MEVPRATTITASAATTPTTTTTDPHATYNLTGKSLLTAVLILLSAVLLLLSAHAFARWYLLRRHRRGRDRRRRRLSFASAPSNPPAAGGGDRGLDSSLLSSLPVLPFAAASEEYGPDECAVCLCEFEGDDRVRVLPRCAHTFHVDCIDMWFFSHSTCPLCRSTVDPAHVTAPRQPSDLCELCRLEEGEEVEHAEAPSTSAPSSSSSTSSHLTDWNEVGIVVDRQHLVLAEEEEKVLGGWVEAIRSILNWELGLHCGGGGDLEMGEGGGQRGRP